MNIRHALIATLALCALSLPAWAAPAGQTLKDARIRTGLPASTAPVPHPIRGVPIKGIGVSLGKVPGGGCAARTTDANGHANFGVWPVLPKGTVYTIAVDALPAAARVTISGAQGGTITRDIARPTATGRQAIPAIHVDSDGKTPLVVVVETAGAQPHELPNIH